jgi:glycosyltransferase involved in cell wall biosynthesis
MPDLPERLVSVVIPHYNDLENLAVCLESLRRQTFPRALFEVIVADNNSAGGVAAVEQIASDVTVIPAPKQGAGPARNAGAAAAQGIHLAFIDSDCVADENWLREGIAGLERFDYVGGQVITTVRNAERLTSAEAFEAVFAFDFKKYIEEDKFSGSGNLFVPKFIFEQVGGFRAGVSEDIDWCHRANAIGYRLGYAERAIVFHAARWKWSELTRRWDRVMTEMIRLAMERPLWRLRWALYAAAVAVSPVAHWLYVVRSRQLVGQGAKYRALLGLLRIRTYRGYRMIKLLAHPPSNDLE